MTPADPTSIRKSGDAVGDTRVPAELDVTRMTRTCFPDQTFGVKYVIPCVTLLNTEAYIHANGYLSGSTQTDTAIRILHQTSGQVNVRFDSRMSLDQV